MKIEVEEVEVDELPEIVRLNSQIFKGMYENPPYSLRHYQNKSRSIEPFILQARAENQLVGDSNVFNSEGSWYIWIFWELIQIIGGGSCHQFIRTE